MTATFLAVDGHRVDLTTSLGRAGLDTYDDLTGVLQAEPSLTWLLTGAILCNDAMLEPHPQIPHQVHTVGDPTEGALVMTGRPPGPEQSHPRTSPAPRGRTPLRGRSQAHDHGTSTARLSGTPTGGSDPYWSLNCPTAAMLPPSLLPRGSVDSVLAVSSHIWDKGQSHPLDRAVPAQDAGRQ